MRNFNAIGRFIRENAGFLLTILLMTASRSSIADWYVVPTGSMQPTIVEGDRIFVDKMAYRLEVPFTDITLMELDTPEPGDIVVFVSEKANTRLVKRVIGVPGDRVAMRNNQLIINGKPLTYSQSAQTVTEGLPAHPHAVQFIGSSTRAGSFSEVTVPQGQYLVLGDNRNNSVDSRDYGFVPAHEIQGKALKVLLSLDPENDYLPRGDRMFIPLI